MSVDHFGISRRPNDVRGSVMAKDDVWLSAQVNRFKAERPTYEKFCKALKRILKQAVRTLGITAVVEARTKEIPSFAEKCIRKGGTDPVNQFTDLCGARVIVESKDQIPLVLDYLEKHFEIHESEDKGELLPVMEFSYQSHHLTVSFKKGTTFPGVVLPDELFDRRDAAESKQAGLPAGPKCKAEIQVRTILQHAWAQIVHDNLYKSDFTPPRHLNRQAALISALLEDGDKSFTRLLDGVHFYRSYYGAYMDRERIQKEIGILGAVSRHDPHNSKLIHQIACLAMSIDDWEKASEVLRSFKGRRRAPLQRDLGIALVKLGNTARGLQYLERAIKMDPDDVDALCELGNVRSNNGLDKALQYYAAAFLKAPTYPRALRKYIQCKIMCEREVLFLDLLSPALENAIGACRERAQVGVHLPWAYFDMGFFYLLLKQPYESLAAFAKAAQLCPTEFAIMETCERIEELREALSAVQTGDLAHYLEWARRFLLVAAVGKIMALKEAKTEEVEGLRKEEREASKKYEKLRRGKDVDNKEVEEARGNANKASELLKNAKKEQTELVKKASEAPAAYLANTDPEYKDKRNLAFKPEEGEAVLFDRRAPVVIVAGGCDESVKRRVMEYKGIIESAFEGFEGVIVSGGTTAGISDIVGSLKFPESKVKKIAYLPIPPPRGDIKHDDYTVRKLPEDDYTPLGPIQTWIDLLASGIRPYEVKLIGINGGDISAFEYRLGLAMGAKVGVLRDSGRKANQIADDPDWKSVPGLLLMPAEKETLRCFLQPTPCCVVIEKEHREKLACETHEEHRKNRSSSLLPKEPVLMDWDKLPTSIKASNYQQIDHIEAKLARVGLKLQKVESRNIVLFDFQPEQIEELAMMEHARWNVERLLDGWTLGERDPANKISPYLVPWNELSPDVRQWDKDTITKLPRRLKKLGYEITKIEQQEQKELSSS